MASSREKIVLIVDDIPANIEILVNILSPMYTVRIAKTGRKALEIAQTVPFPDLVLLDVIMPDMSGFEACGLLKADPRTANIPVIFVSTQSEVVDEARGLEVGGSDYLIKPVNPLIVRARVKTHLALAGVTKELEIQKGRLEKLIKLYVSESTYDLIREAAVHPEKIVAASRELTVFFLDIVRFTTLAETLSPEKTVEILNLVFEVSSQIIRRNLGDIDKFIGDGVMAIFLDPSDAVRAAREIIGKALPDLNSELISRGFSAINVRIGINCGRLIHGDIGASFRKDRTVIGDVVNTANRIQGAAPPGEFLISERVLAHLPNEGDFELFGEVLLKGKSHQIKVYRAKK